jgi:hypothetical protein
MWFLWVAFSFFLPIAAGWLVVERAWPESSKKLRVGLAAALGTGIAGVFYFLALLLSVSPRWMLAASEAALAGVVAILWVTRESRHQPQQREKRSASPLAWILGLAVVVFGAAFLFASDSVRHGGWDSLAMWNMRARMISTSTTAPVSAILDPAFSGTHPDYPLLLPSLVARGWQYARGESATPAVPLTLVALFAAATLLITTGGVEAVSNKTQSWIAGCLLLSTPLLIDTAAAQYADIAIGCFITATVVLYCIYDAHPGDSLHLPFLAGIAAAAAACTKNEGILFLIVVLALRIVLALVGRAPAGGTRETLSFLLGASLGLLALGIFKLGFSPPNDTVRLMTLDAGIRRLTDGQLHREILSGFREALRFGRWYVNPLPLMAFHVAIAWNRPKTRTRSSWLTAGFVLGAMLSGYYLVFLFSPYDLESHVESSLARLMLQLWPTTLVMYSGMVASQASTREPGAVSRNVRLRVAAIIAIAILTITFQPGSKPVTVKHDQVPRIELSRGEVATGQIYTLKITGIEGPQVYVSYTIDSNPMGQFGAYLGNDGTVAFEVSAATPRGTYEFHAVRTADNPVWVDFENAAKLIVR